MHEGDPGSHPAGASGFVRQWNPFHTQVLESFVQALDLEGKVVHRGASSCHEPFHRTGPACLQRLDGSSSDGKHTFDETFADCFMLASETQHTFELGFDFARAIVRERNVMYPLHAPHHEG